MILSGPAQSVRWLSRKWEIACPATTGIAVTIVTWKFGPWSLVLGPWAFAYARDNAVQLDNAYSAVTGIFAVITGFLAGFYGAVQAIVDTRLQRVARTPFFRRFISQMKEATIAGFLLAVVSIPFIVVVPDSPGNWWFTRAFMSLWRGLSAYALAAFVRVGRWLFTVFEKRPPDYDGAG
jgi:hypothetical protein